MEPDQISPLTIMFVPESAYGPTNQCIGVGDVLRRRGHRVVFAAEASWKGKLDALGFEEDLADLTPPSETDEAGRGEQDAGRFWKDFIRDTAPEFRKPTIDQLGTFMRPTWQALIDGSRYCQPQLTAILERVRPDVIVEDNVIAFPALLTAGVPDYIKSRPLGPMWHRLDSSVRETDQVYELPDELRDRSAGSALIYLSLGSLGSADVDLMRRLVDVLGRTPHRYIVSKGPQHLEYGLADNMVGAEFLPQTTLIPQVDAVITHGGNNTTTECLHFGKPMIVLPLFWDQYDNAQRMDELGFGVRLATYTFTAEEMDAALTTVLDPGQRQRLTSIGERVRARNGLHRGADIIEAVGRATHRPHPAGRG